MFFLILTISFIFRFYGVNWDQGFHFHPDERMIIMVADRIRLPRTPFEWKQVFTPESVLNPRFFAYGSFPIYLLKIISWIFGMDNYDGRLTVGRLISAVFDLGTVFLVFLIGKCVIPTKPRQTGRQTSQSRLTVTRRAEGSSINRLQNPKSWKIPRSGFAGLGMTLSNNCIFPLFAAFFYAASVLPIQSSHFFISDIPLTFLTILVLYLSIKFIGLGKIKHILNTKYLILNTLIGIALGLSLATKITAILLIIPVFLALLIRLMRFRNIKSLLVSLLIIAFFSSLTFTITMPYAIFDFKTFRANNLEQSQMRVNPFVFPFTLQYVNTTPYWYFVKNLILWGMGPALGIITLSGTIYTLVLWLSQMKQKFLTKKKISPLWENISILIVFFIIYFAFMGISAVKFMRYMLPLYPLLCLFGGIFIARICQKWKILSRLVLLPIIISVSVWPIMFMSIYSRAQTRITASEWIFNNIPSGAKLGIEHWDDSLPIPLPGKNMQYAFVEYPLYEADTPQKWEIMEDKIKNTDYIILASNRLYTPLSKLTDCSLLPPGRCYTQTAEYYKKLFAGKLGFIKAAEFSSNPRIKVGSLVWEINDQGADESFTVYDHPKVMIFQKK